MLQPRVSVKDRVKKLNDRAAEAQAPAAWPGGKPLGQSRIPRRTTVDNPAAGNGQPPAPPQIHETAPPQSVTRQGSSGRPNDDTTQNDANRNIQSDSQVRLQSTDAGVDDSQTQLNRVGALRSTSTAIPDEICNAPNTAATDISLTLDKTPNMLNSSSSTSPLVTTTVGSTTATDPRMPSNGSFGRRQTARFGHPAVHGDKLPEPRKVSFQVAQIPYERGAHLPHREHEPEAPIWSGKPCPHHDHGVLQDSGASDGATAKDERPLLMDTNPQTPSALRDVNSPTPETNSQSQDSSIIPSTRLLGRTINGPCVQVTIVEKASSVDSDEADDSGGGDNDTSSSVKTTDMPNRTDVTSCGPLVQDTPQQAPMLSQSDTLQQAANPPHQSFVSGRSSPWIRINANGERVFTPLTSRRSASRSSCGSDTDIVGKGVGSNVAVSVKLSEEHQNPQPTAVLKSRGTSTLTPVDQPVSDDRGQHSKPWDDMPDSQAVLPSQCLTPSTGDSKLESPQIHDADNIRQKSDLAGGTNSAQLLERRKDEAFVMKVEQCDQCLIQVSDTSYTVASGKDHNTQAQVPQNQGKTLEAVTSAPSLHHGSPQQGPASDTAGLPGPLIGHVAQLDVPQVDNASINQRPAMTDPSGTPIRQALSESKEDKESSLGWMRLPVPVWEFGNISGAPAFSPSGMPESLVPRYAAPALQRSFTSPTLDVRASPNIKPELCLTPARNDAPDAARRAIRYEECGPIKAVRKHRTNSMVVTCGQVAETEIAVSPREKDIFHRGTSPSSIDEPVKPFANGDQSPNTKAAKSTNDTSMLNKRQAIAISISPDDVVTMRVRSNDIDARTSLTTPKADLTLDCTDRLSQSAPNGQGRAALEEPGAALKISTTNACQSSNDSSTLAGDGDNSSRAPAVRLTEAERCLTNSTQAVKLSTALDFFLPTGHKAQSQEACRNEKIANIVNVSSESLSQSPITELQGGNNRTLDSDDPLSKPPREMPKIGDTTLSSETAMAAVSKPSLKSCAVSADLKAAVPQRESDEKAVIAKAASSDATLLNSAGSLQLIKETSSNSVAKPSRATHNELDLTSADDLEGRRRMLLDAVHDIEEACEERQAAIQAVLKDLLQGLKDYKERSEPGTQRIDGLIELIERHAKDEWSLDINDKLAVLSKAADEEQRARARSVSPPQPRKPDPLAMSPPTTPEASSRFSNATAIDATPRGSADTPEGVRIIPPDVREQWFHNCDVIIRPWPVARRQVSEDGSSGSDTVHEIIKSYVR